MISLIATIFAYVFRVAEILVLIRCVLSWIPGLNNQFTNAVYRVTEPVLAPIRNLIMKLFNTRNIMIDFSPVVALILIGFAERLVYRLLLII